MFKQILVPLDGSQSSESALPVAFQLLQPAGGEVILLRSTLGMHLALPAATIDDVQPQAPQLLAQFREAATAYLATIKRQWLDPSHAIYAEVVSTDPAGAVVDAAAEEGVDLIVMASGVLAAHGASGETRWPLGSVTRRVLHAAPCPVLVLRTSDPIRRILITLDGSALAEQALAPAMEVAQRLGAEVTLLHVVEPEGRHSADEAVSRHPLKRTGGSPEEYLAGLANRYPELAQTIQTTLVSGPVAQCILDFASAQHIDLIAMASGVLAAHGRTGLRRWLFGSVTEKVIHDSTASLLIVRPPSDDLVAHVTRSSPTT